MKNGLKERKITHGTYRWEEDAYSEISDDEEWMKPDAWDGGDDHHCDMVNYEPSDEGLISWVLLGYPAAWLEYAEGYLDFDHFGIRDRVGELLERYLMLGKEEEDAG